MVTQKHEFFDSQVIIKVKCRQDAWELGRES